MYRRAARRFGRMLGRRGAILLTYGAIWALFGYSLIVEPNPDRSGIQTLLRLWPLSTWGVLWIVAGAVAVVSAFMPTGLDWAGYAALPLMAVCWAGSYLAAWQPLGDNNRGWITAAIWGALCVPLFVTAGWREPPRPKEVGGYP